MITRENDFSETMLLFLVFIKLLNQYKKMTREFLNLLSYLPIKLKT